MAQIVQGSHVIDSETGATVEDLHQVKDLVLENRSDPIAELIAKSGKVPIHVLMAKELGITPATLTTYVGNPPASPGAYLGRKIYLTGCIVYFSGRFTPKVTDPTQPGYKTGEGFYAFMMKTDMTTKFEYKDGKQVKDIEVPVILKCDGVKIRETLVWLMDQYGWFDWKTDDGAVIKVPVVFNRGGGVGDPFYLQVLPE